MLKWVLAVLTFLANSPFPRGKMVNVRRAKTILKVWMMKVMKEKQSLLTGPNQIKPTQHLTTAAPPHEHNPITNNTISGPDKKNILFMSLKYFLRIKTQQRN